MEGESEMSKARFTQDDLLRIAANRVAGKSSPVLPDMATKTQGMPKTPFKSKGKRTPKPNRYAGFPDFCARMGLPRPTSEFRFHSTRLWRFDWVWANEKLALEVEGAIWTNGGHSRGSGRVKDHEKFSEAACLGYRLVFCQPKTLMTAATADLIRRALDWHKTLAG